MSRDDRMLLKILQKTPRLRTTFDFNTDFLHIIDQLSFLTNLSCDSSVLPERNLGWREDWTTGGKMTRAELKIEKSQD